MTVVLALEERDLIGPDLRWPLRVAVWGGGEIVLIVRGITRGPCQAPPDSLRNSLNS